MALSEAALAAIAAGASATGALGSAGIAGARNMKIAKYSAEFQRQQIREQNQYNSPIAQMERYHQAGLNPQLIYGAGSQAAGEQNQIAKYDTPVLPTPDLGPILGNIASAAMQFALQKKDLQLKEQELRNKQEEQFNLRSSRMGQDIENAWKSVVTGFDPGLVMDMTNRDQILNSKRMSEYNLGLQGKEVMNALHEAQKQLANYSAKEKEKIVNTMFDLQKQLLEKQIEGKDINNEINRIEMKLQKNLSEIGGKGGVKLIIDFLRAILR